MTPPPKRAKATAKEYIDGIEVRRAECPVTGEPIPTRREELPWHMKLVNEALVKLIKGWGKRQILKGLAIAAGAIGGAELAQENNQQAVAAWVVAALCGLAEIGLSHLGRKRAKNRIRRLEDAREEDEE